MTAPSENEAIGAALNHACDALPESWKITIELERGAGTVYLHDEEGDLVERDRYCDLFSDELKGAIDKAIEMVAKAADRNAT